MLALAVQVATGCGGGNGPRPGGPVRVSVFATGLENPRGLALGPDGALDVSDYSFFFGPRSGKIRRIELPDEC